MRASQTVHSQLPTRSDRLDSLPFGREHRKLLVGSGVGWALDAMDVGLISYVMAALVAEWSLSNTQASWLGSIGFVGMMIGASVGGLLADKWGRRNVFALTLLTYGIATGAAAFSVGLVMLLILRFIVGVGLGAELPVASTLVSEFAPRKNRGRIVVALESFWAVGWIMSALLGYFLVPKEWGGWPGWRWALLVGIVPAVYALVVRHGLPESVRFLESWGRLAEAERSVRLFEKGSSRDSTVPFDEAVALTPTSVAKGDTTKGTVDGVTVEKNRLGEKAGGDSSIFSAHMRGRTTALWVVWFFVNLAYYGAFTWMPTLLYLQGHSLVKSFEFTLMMTLAQLPGYAAAAWLIEKWGRRLTLSVFLCGSAVSAILFGLQSGATGIIITGLLLSFFNLGAWGALYAIGPEIYPTAMRGTGTGAAAAVGRVAGVVAPLIVPIFLEWGSTPLVFTIFGASFFIAVAGAVALPERHNMDMVE
ncbi:MFS transporter [Corynebacterium kroppenstedtii]|uniref:MFS transporter n=1 Tax=Corynebacterium kroppenstedtii TaxID=161879 RepID=UPI002655C97F|nr:MFS transporter [Corynebacterium kroppenstedtii]MDN8624418.1 MFS transporter [Corynebacterium kroppenstedtii]